MEKISVKDKDIVIPGELLADGINYIPSGRAFRDGSKIHSTSIGIVNIKGRVIKVIPLAGKYIPKKGDTVIGKITTIGRGGWMADVNSASVADLSIAEGTSEYIDLNKTTLSKYFDIGDFVLAGIINISETGYIKITARNRPYRKLSGGILIEVSPTKIPRIIGKQGSMISMLKQATDCEIIVGQNGWIWVKGEPKNQMYARMAIKMVESEAHTSGLTDKIKEWLEKKIGKKKSAPKGGKK